MDDMAEDLKDAARQPNSKIFNRHIKEFKRKSISDHVPDKERRRWL